MLRKWGEGKHSTLLPNLERGGYEPMNAAERLLRGSHSPAGSDDVRTEGSRLDEKASNVRQIKRTLYGLLPR